MKHPSVKRKVKVSQQGQTSKPQSAKHRASAQGPSVYSVFADASGVSASVGRKNLLHGRVPSCGAARPRNGTFERKRSSLSGHKRNYKRQQELAQSSNLSMSRQSNSKTRSNTNMTHTKSSQQTLQSKFANPRECNSLQKSRMLQQSIGG